jgi:hypothetical protein
VCVALPRAKPERVRRGNAGRKRMFAHFSLITTGCIAALHFAVRQSSEHVWESSQGPQLNCVMQTQVAGASITKCQ